MLLIIDPEDHPALAALTRDAWRSWINAVNHCAGIRSDIVPVSCLGLPEEHLVEWERVALAQRLPFGNLRLLRRGTLWDI